MRRPSEPDKDPAKYIRDYFKKNPDRLQKLEAAKEQYKENKRKLKAEKKKLIKLTRKNYKEAAVAIVNSSSEGES